MHCQDRFANAASQLEARHKPCCQILEEQTRKGTGAVFSHVMVFPDQNYILDFYISSRSSARWLHIWLITVLHHSQCMQTWGLRTPSYEKTILGSKQPVSGIKFFCRFSLRLSENNRSRIMFIAKFGPTASDFGYEILTIFGLRLEPSCYRTFGAGLDLTCPSFRGLNSDHFPFFDFLDCTSRTWVSPV